ncbi:hypothetical protein ACP179_01960 (plasmid) [Xenorhabdus stockiae]|uniref:hypothetical protein n=1 Tax=Xenorhabdus stockiae TaxID=351614 RepID=UPI003CF8583F
MIASPLLATIFIDALTDNMSLFLQWCGFTGGLILTGCYGWQFLKSRKISSWVPSISGAIMMFIYANSLLFVSQENVGVLNNGYIINITNIKDVQCEKNMLLVNLAKKNEPTEWRCPQNLVILGNTSKPFLPWPSYTTGKSIELTAVIHTMLDNAINVEDIKK